MLLGATMLCKWVAPLHVLNWAHVRLRAKLVEWGKEVGGWHFAGSRLVGGTLLC